MSTIPSGPYIAQIYDASDPDVKTSAMQAAPTKATPIDADSLILIDSAASNAFKRTLWSDVKSVLGAVFQPLNSFLTTLAAIGGTSGTGNLARVTSPTFVTPTLGAASATSLSIAGTGNLTQGTTSNIYNETSQNQVYFNYSNGNGVAIRGTTSPRIYMYGVGGPAGAAGTGLLAWANTTLDGSPSSTISQQSAGVVQIGTTAANASGSLLLAGITIGAGTKILKVLSATATLDFGSVAANSFADLTITVTGAALGDTVSIGVPNGSLINDISFFGWVSATNTVTVRCSNVSSTTARDPASGTFRATVTQF